jgi:hypothetical protein
MDRINGANTIDIGGGRRGFRDRNAVGGLAGTEVTADFLNALQEEVLAVIAAASLAPDAGDLTQLLKSIRLLISDRYAVAGGTANALTAAFSPALPALVAGTAIKLKIATTNTGPATLVADAMPALSIVRRDGYPLAGGELVAGAIEYFCYDGASWRMVSPSTKARYWRMTTPSGSIPSGVPTRVGNFAVSASTLAGSTVNASAGTVTIGAADAGVYVLTSNLAMVASGVFDLITLRVNGTVVGLQSAESPSDVSGQDPGACAIVVLAAGDIVDVAYTQVKSSPGTNSLVAIGSHHFAGVRIGD